MEIPGYQPFYIDSVDALRAEIDRLGLDITVDDELQPLAQPLVIGARNLPNRFCAQPIAGGDAAANGAPGPLTLRRYRRYVEGDFALIWVERTIAGPNGQPGQLRIHDDTAAVFAEMVRNVRTDAPENPVLVLQIVSESVDSLLHAATLAAAAGFDGVDLQCPRELLPEAVSQVRERFPDLILATRLCVYEAVRGGFGVAAADYRKPDMTEPIRLVRQLQERGLALLNVTAASPILSGTQRGERGRSDSEQPDEHPLMTLQRQLRLARELRAAVPGLPVVGSGFSWLRQFVPQVVAAALRSQMIDMAGLGRGALAHPDLPRDVLKGEALDGASTCIVCFACSRMQEEGDPVGCVLRDAGTYGPIYRQMRRFDADQLMSGAARCHLCEAAPCVAASPTRTDIPAFIQAYRNRDEARAYEIIRGRDPLPELTARFSPGWLESEGACIETTLTGTPVPILDLQYAIAWRARENEETGVRIPVHPPPNSSSFAPVAIIGAGPAGLAAAIRLLEHGHIVHLYEQSDRIGGVPVRLLAQHRALADPRAEIEAVLAPALAEGRLHLHLGVALGKDLSLDASFLAGYAAVLIATGLWDDRFLGPVRTSAGGVMGALAFLESPGDVIAERVAILAGGDGAMDAARVAQSRGAKEIFIVYRGARSEMHWHMSEDWFKTAGVQAMMHWEPLRYEMDAADRVAGVRLRHAILHTETALPVGLVVEAMGLGGSDAVWGELKRVDMRGDHGPAELAEAGARIYQAGALVNGGASVGHCVAEGLGVADTIHRGITQ